MNMIVLVVGIMTLGKTQQTQDNEGKCEQYKNGFGLADFTE